MATKAEREHMGSVAALGCIVCRNLGFGASPAEVSLLSVSYAIADDPLTCAVWARAGLELVQTLRGDRRGSRRAERGSELFTLRRCQAGQ